MERKMELSREITNEKPLDQPQPELPEQQQEEEQSESIKSTTWNISKYLNLQIILKNKSSVARDHMANERTLLAWIRTSLTFLTFGIGFLQFYRIEIKTPNYQINNELLIIEKLTKPIGLICIILSILTLSFGTFRYFQVQNSLMIDNYPATRLTIIILIMFNLSMLILLMILNIKISIQ